MEFAYLEGGGNGVAPIRVFPSAAGLTWTKGFTANLESGVISNGAPADGAFVGVVNQTVAVATAAGDLIEVIEARSDVIFRVEAVIGTKTALANADIGTAFDLKSTALNKIDLDDTTGGAWVIVAFNNTYKKNDGTTCIMAWVKCLAANRSVLVN